ncbi:cytochrome C and Quinol oxidase polypeptide I [bacterium BMS3Bbin06]|nr:cytochrome C and Quinol oxidase polypeptide I [bacterium BMS3Abin08]GBE35034.1 cytochrome C and Quinol oxidase polypeptide I [bacterium BMS3Bbin06]HDO36032.1 hypothetical protein [Nitrospirota bacterium]HDY71309.1 hypothetical protein [Nitrospirota bacterium]
MDRYVKAFIVISIVYLGLASVLGVFMIMNQNLLGLKFVHTHLMLIGWVSMMIYGVGYHILPRFSGRLIKSKALVGLQFWFANIGLIGMVLFYTLKVYHPEVDAYRILTGLSGVVEILSIAVFFYNMLATLLARQEEA